MTIHPGDERLPGKTKNFLARLPLKIMVIPGESVN
jgi:hypothetical protein